jgi:hypothetical protein
MPWESTVAPAQRTARRSVNPLATATAPNNPTKKSWNPVNGSVAAFASAGVSDAWVAISTSVGASPPPSSASWLARACFDAAAALTALPLFAAPESDPELAELLADALPPLPDDAGGAAWLFAAAGAGAAGSGAAGAGAGAALWGVGAGAGAGALTGGAGSGAGATLSAVC